MRVWIHFPMFCSTAFLLYPTSSGQKTRAIIALTTQRRVLFPENHVRADDRILRASPPSRCRISWPSVKCVQAEALAGGARTFTLRGQKAAGRGACRSALLVGCLGGKRGEEKWTWAVLYCCVVSQWGNRNKIRQTGLKKKRSIDSELNVLAHQVCDYWASAGTSTLTWWTSAGPPK